MSFALIIINDPFFVANTYYPCVSGTVYVALMFSFYSGLLLLFLKLMF